MLQVWPTGTSYPGVPELDVVCADGGISTVDPETACGVTTGNVGGRTSSPRQPEGSRAPSGRVFATQVEEQPAAPDDVVAEFVITGLVLFPRGRSQREEAEGPLNGILSGPSWKVGEIGAEPTGNFVVVLTPLFPQSRDRANRRATAVKVLSLGRAGETLSVWRLFDVPEPAQIGTGPEA
uniref:Uncharacterized protein n=1 Tax=Ananas comosus var. bracteatus TaxID=296719 RepID=A0A6V7PUN3_ANACO|nr:unnamed protein product [Ananas comosus var. bracteatus]